MLTCSPKGSIMFLPCLIAYLLIAKWLLVKPAAQTPPAREDCTPEELANHKRACEAAEKHGLSDLECPSFFFKDEKGNVGHVLKAPFGIGVQVYEEETFFEELDESDRLEI